MFKRKFWEKVKIKLTNDCCEPTYKTSGAAACDCLANINSPIIVKPMDCVQVDLGFALEMPKGMKASLKPRSGLASKKIIAWLGTIDNDYRGIVKANIMNLSQEDFEIHPYDRIGQLEFEEFHQVKFKVVETLSKTKRGEGGFGSTGI